MDTATRTSPSEAPALVRCVGLEVGYRGRALLPPLDLTIRRGELWAIVGRNGAGKTTWFRTLLGLQAPVGGRIDRSAAPRMSYIPQQTALDPLFPMLAREVVGLGRERGRGFLRPRFGEPPGVAEGLARVGAADLADRPYRDLSEGQKQRVLLARLAASDPDVALLDEPTAAMDAVAEREAFAFLDGLRRDRGTAVLVVSHYLAIARQFADHAVFLDRESQTVFVGTPDEVFAHPEFERSYADAAHA